MNIWNTNRIIESYNKGEISEPDKFRYFLGIILLAGFVNTVILSVGHKPIPVLSLMIGLIFYAICVTYVYYKCQSADPSHFIEKFTILLLPTYIKFILVFYPCYYAFYYLAISPGSLVKGSHFLLWIIYFGTFSLYYRHLGIKIPRMVG